MSEIWYRYEDYGYEIGIFGEPSKALIVLREFEVLRTTPKGVWLKLDVCEKRFVLRDATKRYACPTKEEARISFAARKKKQLQILEREIMIVRSALLQAEDTNKELVSSLIFNALDAWLMK